MSNLDDTKTSVEKLKAEGNAFHTQGHLEDAILKYTEAIQLDQGNAILYANRSASHLSMKNYLDAACDARQAVVIDPSYTKAWARLAKATHALWQYDQSIKAWKRALETLPVISVSQLSPTDAHFKQQFEEGLKAAEDAHARQVSGESSNPHLVSMNDPSKMPWNRAMALMPELERTQTADSSAWVIVPAYREFNEGVQAMKALRLLPNRSAYGHYGALADITNGILRDRRVFHMDGANWLDQYRNQLAFEITQSGAWVDGGVEHAKRQAENTLREKGWDTARKALAITVRSWFMRAFLEEGARRNARVATQFYGSALTLLEWGQTKWRDVSRDDRGAIFENTFVRGVRRYYLSAYLMGVKDHGDGSVYTLDRAEALALAMVKEVSDNWPRGNEEYVQDRGFYYSFVVYPRAEAYSTLGFVNMERAHACRGTDPETAMRYYSAAAEWYLKAAESYPEDDEFHFYFLKIAFEACWHRADPIRDILPLCQPMQEALQKMRAIWEFSSNKGTMNEHVQQLIYFNEGVFTGLISKLYTLDTPSSLVALHKPE
ncbi:unnamed protein product [Somion occarium]|uniref:TPR-like protein n=1 Tax=Somion occarium TaxID=3059160 RepID=A0ABP1CI54_9APHY